MILTDGLILFVGVGVLLLARLSSEKRSLDCDGGGGGDDGVGGDGDDTLLFVVVRFPKNGQSTILLLRLLLITITRTLCVIN